MNYASFPSPSTHEDALFYNCKKRISWKHDKSWVPRDVRVCSEYKRGIGVIFWTGVYSHVSQSPRKQSPSPLLCLLCPLHPPPQGPHTFFLLNLKVRCSVDLISCEYSSEKWWERRCSTEETGSENHVLGGGTYTLIRPLCDHGRLSLH